VLSRRVSALAAFRAPRRTLARNSLAAGNRLE
jgi:hypothetical protein